ncbi:LamG domain-containing protein [Herbidospora mongoliensis]|uniref:LamG domain-containing protein n=1 Tax=Herbidospora mongoliensis TaxID=688067 RepID=UPI0008295B22|nr:LamG-like jellyroll fold domain-containing protein [Herbidospora mongoliensis]
MVSRSRAASLAVLISLTTVVALPAPATAVPVPIPGGPQCVAAVDDQFGAAGLAAQCGNPVEVLSERTETSQVFAQPDGSLESVTSLFPTQVVKNGVWTDVDTDLRLSGGVTPVATSANVRFSTGGADPMVTLTEGSAVVRIKSPWTLPTPTLSGDTATYADVLPDVDLRLRAEPDGFSQFLVVNTPAAAALSELKRIAFPLEASGGASIRENESALEVVDAAGNVLFESGSALMWDADGAGDEGADTAPGRTAEMDVEVAAHELVVVPDQALLTASDATFPIYIDPAFSKPSMGGNWTHTNSCSPGTSFYTSYRSELRVGRQWNTSCKWRAYMRFDTAQLAGATIQAAEFAVTADHVANCAGASTNLLFRNNISAMNTATWNSTSSGNVQTIGTEKFDANESSCPSGDQKKVYDDGTARVLEGRMQSQATARASQTTFALISANEGDDMGWSNFIPGSVALIITYNHTPSVPTALTITTDCGISCAWVRSGTPTLRAVAADPNGGTLARVEFEVYDRARTTRKAASGTAVSNRASGQAAPWKVTPTLAEGAYSWRVRGCDAYVCGGWGGWFDFTVDTTAPTNVSVTSADYPAATEGTWNGAAGQAGTFAIGASGANRFELTLNGVNKGWVNTTGDVWTGPMTPDRDGVNLLTARAADAAGNVAGSPFTYEFLVRPVPAKAIGWGFNETSGNTAASDPAGINLDHKVGSIVRTAGKNGGSAVVLDGASAWASLQPVVDTKIPFTVTALVKLDSATASGPATAVSAHGPSGSGFRLGHRAEGWCFSMYAADDGAETKACSTEAVGTGWTHLAGVYDGTRLRLYVNGLNWEDTDQVPFTSTWSATQGWSVGRAKAGGVLTQYWNGAVDRVAAYQKALTQSEIVTDGAKG